MHTPHVFGDQEHLFGIHCPPNLAYDREVQSNAPKVAVLMLTAGMLTSVGPSRLHVRMADALSSKGIPSFRFDLSGIGESLAVGSQGSSLKRATQEVKQAMDMLANEYQYTKFMLFGLCSGADDAIACACEDDRIAGASLMDACGYRTPGHFVPYLRQKYLPKVLSARKWCDSIRQKMQGNAKTASTMPQGFDIREFPDRDQAEREIETLVDRGVRLQFIYTSGVIDYYSYADQFFDMFPKLRNRTEISVVHQPRWDHVALLEEDRTELLHTIVSWFESLDLAV